MNPSAPIERENTHRNIGIPIKTGSKELPTDNWKVEKVANQWGNYCEAVIILNGNLSPLSGSDKLWLRLNRTKGLQIGLSSSFASPSNSSHWTPSERTAIIDGRLCRLNANSNRNVFFA